MDRGYRCNQILAGAYKQVSTRRSLLLDELMASDMKHTPIRFEIKTLFPLGVLVLAAGCTALDYSLSDSRAAGTRYLDPDRGAWLTPEQRDRAACIDGQLLVCRYGAGKLSEAWCACPYVRTRPAELLR
jgi:hypothetical protein